MVRSRVRIGLFTFSLQFYPSFLDLITLRCLFWPVDFVSEISRAVWSLNWFRFNLLD
jgi:hypothetical protein